jgi:hypothetical protein
MVGASWTQCRPLGWGGGWQGRGVTHVRTFGIDTSRLPLMETDLLTHDLSADDAFIRTEAVIA